MNTLHQILGLFIVAAVGLVLVAAPVQASSVTDADDALAEFEGLFASAGDDTLDAGTASSHDPGDALTSGIVGDMNHDGVINTADVSLFVLALTNPGQYEADFGVSPTLVGDINQDGAFNTADVSAFVALLTSGDQEDWQTWSSRGSDQDSPAAVPLPAAAWAGLGMLGLLGAVHVVRRRRVAAAF